jgi:hypothetical protein
MFIPPFDKLDKMNILQDWIKSLLLNIKIKLSFTIFDKTLGLYERKNKILD